MSKQTILVTGASSGFGLTTAKALAQAGHSVYASMRETATRNAPQVAALADWSKTAGLDLRSVELDVQADSSVASGISHILKDAGHLDVIVHNAGHMVFGPAEAFTPDQFIQQYDVNVLGAQRVNRAALPHLRRQGRGLLVWVGSSSTRGGTPPFLAPYFAAKAAMDALADPCLGGGHRTVHKDRVVSWAPRSRNQTHDAEVAARQNEFTHYYLILVGKIAIKLPIKIQ